jgi:hypothetical protein
MAGNTELWLFHGRAIAKMVDIRGSMKSLGPKGFLGHLLAWSVYNPKFKVVNGPYPGQLEDGEW